MISSDYTQEIGMTTQKRSVPLPYVIAIFALIALAAGIIVKQVHAQKAHESEADATPVPVQVSSR